MTFDIQQARPSDMAALVPLAREFYGQGHLPGVFNPDVFVPRWENWIQQRMGVVFIAWEGFVPVGAIGGLFGESPTTGDLEFSEMFWFVTAAARSGGAGKMLYEACEKAAERTGAARIYMMHLEDENGEKVASFLQFQGFRPVESLYVKEF